MRVASFKVSNYRSIDSAEIDLADLTCLVGPNNEGKSNLLRALGLGLNAVLGRDQDMRRPGVPRIPRQRHALISYDPALDRPVGKTNRSLTTITVRFELTDSECDEFREAVGHSLNGDLPAQVQFNIRGEANVQYKKQRVGSQLTEKADTIRGFLRDRLSFQYVPAIRTADDAAMVISALIRNRLRALESDEEFVRAQELMYKKGVEALGAVEEDLREVLPRFLPNVTGVQLEMDARENQFAFDTVVRSVQIDDGVTTELAAKGSGVQSLAALALLRHGVQADSAKRASLLALEEPEAHLHSGALHQLRPLLAEIAEEQQLVFATHAAMLVPTTLRASTVIVRNNHAHTSKSLSEVREALGVRLADNLESARLVLVVEGTADVNFWRIHLLDDEHLAAALEFGSLAIEKAVGAGNLSYHLQMLRRSACDAFVVYDGDAPGRKAVDAALNSGELLDDEYVLLAWDSQPQAELEDLLAADWLAPVLKAHFGTDITVAPGDDKWSDRLRSALTAASKSNSKKVVDRAKEAIWVAFEGALTEATSDRGHEVVASVGDQLRNRLGLQ